VAQAAENAADLNRQHYDRMTSGQEDHWRKMAAPRHRRQVLLGEVDRLAPASVVDLGCGNGQLLAEVRGRHPGARLAGIDLSSEQMKENARALPWAAWHTANLDAPVSFAPELLGAFDTVMATEVIEHVDRPEELLRNARALARPGGHLLLSTQSGPVRETERRVGHIRHFTGEEIAALLARTGWRSERVWNTGFPFHDLSKWYANRDPGASMTRFSERGYGWKENLVCFGLRVAFRLNSRSRGAQLFAVARNPPR
jgi:2-polyprenyl-3-methyl-5-hydroxy-6-metoxy-1,4-benzoquinol methylase